jgi:negative regulator of flagellin synthesis FlgM
MNIFGVFSTQGSQGLAAAKGVEAMKAAEQATEVTTRQGVGEVHDAVTLSTEAVRAAEGASDIRMDKVAAIKAAIADGSYETPEKLDIALDRLLERLA